jgi:hypothetical protein
MSRLKECNPSKLYDRGQRAIAKLARIARCDCVNGGARALVIADRLAAMGAAEDYGAVVSAAYTSSTGCAPDYLAYECPECGSACMGIEAALSCCQPTDDFIDDDEFAVEDDG